MSKSKGIFLVAQYYMKPKDHVNTSKKGWMNDPENLRYDEQVSISKGLRTKDMHAQVILNLSDKKVEKNSFETGKSFDEIFRYFLDNYTQYIAQTMAQLDPSYLNAVANVMEQEIKQAEEIPTAEINEEVKAQ